MRIGAYEKSNLLVSYARLLGPISTSDANIIFNEAVEVASELDREVMAQIRLLDRLVARSGPAFSDARQTARHLSDIIADAGVRLDGNEHFPWEEAMSALARLDAPLALANVARWDDEGVASLRQGLASVLRTGLIEGTIRPTQAASLALFLDRDQGVLGEALKRSDKAGAASFRALAEEAAYDVLVRQGRRQGDNVTRYVEQRGLNGRWTSALIRQEHFLSTFAPDPPSQPADAFAPGEGDNPLSKHAWTPETLTDPAALQSAVEDLRERGLAGRGYLSLDTILGSARAAVATRDRVAHIAALAGLERLTITNEAVKALLNAIDVWWDSPAVQAWCKTSLAEVIVRRLPELTSYLRYGEDNLSSALARTGLSGVRTQDVILSGIERHVDALGSDLIFALAAMVGCKLETSDAADLVDWYANRLVERIPAEDRDQTAPTETLPQQVDEAVARFLFAYLGDYDLRLRWRAAHAVRRLARTDEQSTLSALAGEYERRLDPAFRGRGLAFYWLAARLWFVVAWDRIAGERPELAGKVGRLLLEIALNDAFPHLLVRSFARDACEKLTAAGHLSLSPEESTQLAVVDASALARKPPAKGIRRSYDYSDDGRRFEFDLIDTLPYWYQPLLTAFAGVNGERFLQEVERWIIDVWGYDGDIRAFDKERRRGRFDDRYWALSSHRHGEAPTLERLNTHLEWRAMWCAAGELLKTEPLAILEEDSFDAWGELGSRIRREKLSEPPLWSADLRVSTPLQARNWRSDSRSLDEWVHSVGELDHRAELLPSDATEYVVVDGASEVRTVDRTVTTNVSSALVQPDTGGSLLRALQTMDDSWDYRLPEEGDDHEIDEAPYRLLGWLQSSSRDTRIDDKDPFRGYASIIVAYPGQLVMSSCELTRDEAGSPRWSHRQAERPMFVFEAWGEREKDDERYETGIAVAGHRLLAHKEQLIAFLHSKELDLIVDVEVTRRGRERRRYSGEEDKKTPEGRFDRLYRLDRGGALEVAEGRLGHWAGNRPPA